MNRNFVLQALILAPLLVVTYQVVRLSRTLRTSAWVLLAIGYILASVFATTVLLWPPVQRGRIFVSLVIYGFIASGFHTLQNDLSRMMNENPRLRNFNERRFVMATVISKSIFTSKLFWLGAIQVLLGALDLVKTNVLESEHAAWGAVATGLITILLRKITEKPVTLKGGEAVQVPSGGVRD